MRNLSKKAKTIIAGAAIAGLASTGVAYAYWSSTGSGSGSANAGAGTNDLTINSANVTGLVPGSDTTLDVVIANTHPTTSEAYTTASYVVTTTPSSCLAADFTITGLPVGHTVAANTVEASVPAVLHFANTSANQDPCKNATISIAYSLN